MEHHQQQQQSQQREIIVDTCGRFSSDERYSDSGLGSLRGSSVGSSADERSGGSRGSVFSGSEEILSSPALSLPSSSSILIGGVNNGNYSSSSTVAPLIGGPHHLQQHPSSIIWRSSSGAANLLYPTYPHPSSIVTDPVSGIVRHTENVQPHHHHHHHHHINNNNNNNSNSSLLMSHSMTTAVVTGTSSSSSSSASTAGSNTSSSSTGGGGSSSIPSAGTSFITVGGQPGAAMLTPHPAMIHHQLAHPSSGAPMYSQIPEVLWKPRYSALPPMTPGHLPAAVAEELFERERVILHERLQREHQERESEKHKEREREKYQERERAEKERLEKQRAEQAVHKHFEESLRRAQQKQRNRNLITTLPPPTTSSSVIRNEDDRKRTDHEQQSRLIRPEPRESVSSFAPFAPYQIPAQKLVNNTGGVGNKTEYYSAGRAAVIGSKSSQISLPKSCESNYSVYNNYPVLQTPLNFLPTSSTTLSGTNLSSVIDNNKAMKLENVKKSNASGGGILAIPMVERDHRLGNGASGSNSISLDNHHVSTGVHHAAHHPSTVINVPPSGSPSSVIVKNESSTTGGNKNLHHYHHHHQQQQHINSDMINNANGNNSNNSSSNSRQSSISSPSSHSASPRLRTDSSAGYYSQIPPSQSPSMKSYDYHHRSPTQSPLQQSRSPIGSMHATTDNKITNSSSSSHHRLATHRQSPLQRNSPLPSQSQIQQRQSSPLQSQQRQSPPEQRYPLIAPPQPQNISVYSKQPVNITTGVGTIAGATYSPYTINSSSSSSSNNNNINNATKIGSKVGSPIPPSHMYVKPSLSGITTGTPICRAQEVSLSPVPLISTKAVVTPCPYQQLPHHQLPPTININQAGGTSNMTPPPAHSSRTTTGVTVIVGSSSMIDSRQFHTAVPSHSSSINSRLSPLSSSMDMQPLDLGIRDYRSSNKRKWPPMTSNTITTTTTSTTTTTTTTTAAAAVVTTVISTTSTIAADNEICSSNKKHCAEDYPPSSRIVDEKTASPFSAIKDVVDRTIDSSFPENSTKDEQSRFSSVNVITSATTTDLLVSSLLSKSSYNNNNSVINNIMNNSNTAISNTITTTTTNTPTTIVTTNKATSGSINFSISRSSPPIIVTKSTDYSITTDTNNSHNNNNISNNSKRWVKKAWLVRHTNGDNGVIVEDKSSELINNRQCSLVGQSHNSTQQQPVSPPSQSRLRTTYPPSSDDNDYCNKGDINTCSDYNNVATTTITSNNAESNLDDDEESSATTGSPTPPMITSTSMIIGKDDCNNSGSGNNSPPILVNTLHSVGSMAINSISKIRMKNANGASSSAANKKQSKENNGNRTSSSVVLNGHISANEESSSSDLDAGKSPPKRVPPRLKRKKAQIAVSSTRNNNNSNSNNNNNNKKKTITGATTTSSSTDSDKESAGASDKDSDISSNPDVVALAACKKISSNSSSSSAIATTFSPNKDNSRKRGRKPKSSVVNDDGAPKVKKSKEYNSWKDAFPKPPISQLKKTGESFLQDGNCFDVAPKLAKCRECRWAPHQRSRLNIFCRFYAFRRLRYTKNGQLAIAGFSDPHKDASEDDLSLWLPNTKNPPDNLDLEMARFLLYRIGYQFCDLLRQEKEALSVHISEEKKIAWKRVVQGVREMCDVCETTIFNIHWACNKCGFVVCIDCYKGRKNGCMKIWREPGKDRDDLSWLLCTNRQPHEQDKLMLTQIIAGDCVSNLAAVCHESCAMWDIPMQCVCPIPTISSTVKSICKEILNNVKQEERRLVEENTKPKPSANDIATAIANNNNNNNNNNINNGNNNGSAPAEIKSEVDSPLNWLADVALSNEVNSVSDLTVTNTPEDRKDFSTEDNSSSNRLLSNGNQTDLKHYVPKVIKQLKWQEPIPTRFMSIHETKLTYPGVPHSWLCDGRLLRLLDPYHPGNYVIFQDQWKRGQPVIISDVAKKLDSALWHPDSFAKDFGDIKNDLVNCMNGDTVSNQPMRKFWEGFEYVSKRMKDEKGAAMLLKLKDWPTAEDFAEMLPSRFNDLMNCLPLGEYTHRNGKLNLASRLPECFVRPDLGPKLYNAYGSALYPNKGTTNLHLDVSDAVNLMVYVGIPKDGDNEEFIKEAYRAIDEAGCDILTRRRVREKGELPGAIWHIYHASEADKIRDLLNKVALEQGIRLQPHHDPIHDQSWYLDGPLRERLYKEYAVESYAIVQCLGDAVFIPAGAPHQVRNLHNCIKVAEDFVSPENVSHCFHLTHEFRDLSDTHTNHEDKLQIKNIMYHAVKDSLSVLGAAYSNYANKTTNVTIDNDNNNNNSSSDNVNIDPNISNAVTTSVSVCNSVIIDNGTTTSIHNVTTAVVTSTSTNSSPVKEQSTTAAEHIS